MPVSVLFPANHRSSSAGQSTHISKSRSLFSSLAILLSCSSLFLSQELLGLYTPLLPLYSVFHYASARSLASDSAERLPVTVVFSPHASEPGLVLTCLPPLSARFTGPTWISQSRPRPVLSHFPSQ